MARSSPALIEALSSPVCYAELDQIIGAIASMDVMRSRRQMEESRPGPDARLWVNPDCSLKARGWAEVQPALVKMIEAAHRARSKTAE